MLQWFVVLALVDLLTAHWFVKHCMMSHPVFCMSSLFLGVILVFSSYAAFWAPCLAFIFGIQVQELFLRSVVGHCFD